MLSVDGQAAGKLSQGEYISVPVQPGHHTYGYERVAISSEGETKREVDVPQGQSIYFEIVEKNEAGIYAHVISAAGAGGAGSGGSDQAQDAAADRAAGGSSWSTRSARSCWSAGDTRSTGARPSAQRQTRQKGRRAATRAAKLHRILLAQENGGRMSFLSRSSEHFGVAIDDQQRAVSPKEST